MRKFVWFVSKNGVLLWLHFRAHNFQGIVKYCTIQSATTPTVIVSHIFTNGFVHIHDSTNELHVTGDSTMTRDRDSTMTWDQTHRISAINMYSRFK